MYTTRPVLVVSLPSAPRVGLTTIVVALRPLLPATCPRQSSLSVTLAPATTLTSVVLQTVSARALAGQHEQREHGERKLDRALPEQVDVR